MNPDLRPRPTELPFFAKKANRQISLSDAQLNQIKEIFELFDTDGGGSIDRKELEFAMTALGFQSQASGSNLPQSKNTAAPASANNLLDAIVGDGKVTLDEFVALMTGEVLGRNQYEEAQTVFAALCRSDGEGRHDNLVTLGKLEAACKEFGVCFLHHLFFCFLFPSGIWHKSSHLFLHTMHSCFQAVKSRPRPKRLQGFMHGVMECNILVVILLNAGAPVIRGSENNGGRGIKYLLQLW